MWVSLSRDLFQLLLSWCRDGVSMARFASTCHTLWTLYKVNKFYLHPSVRTHLVRCEDGADIERALVVDQGARFYVDIPVRDRATMLANLLWHQHGFNVYLFCRYANIDYDAHSFIEMLGLHLGNGEEAYRSFVDEHGNGIRTSDFYNFSTSSISRFEWIRDHFFPGTLQWRAIQWPRGKDVEVYGSEWHRGNCTQIIFRSTLGIHTPDHESAKLLKKHAKPIGIHHGSWKRPRLHGEKKIAKRVHAGQFITLPSTHAELQLFEYLKKDKEEEQERHRLKAEAYWANKTTN